MSDKYWGFKEGNLVEVSNADALLRDDPDCYDHGRIESLNDDGTVTVHWYRSEETLDEDLSDIAIKKCRD